jgi:hypothetical protein
VVAVSLCMHVQMIEERKTCLTIRYKTIQYSRGARRHPQFELNLTL